MDVIYFLLCAIPTAVNLVAHKNGRGKEDKIRDKLIIIIISSALALIVKWVFDYDLLRILGLMLGVYILTFDYAIVWLLRERGVIRGTAKVFQYTGKSTYWYDQLIAKIDWRIRLVIRLAVFAVIVWWVFF